MHRRRFLKAGLAAALLPAARSEARATVYVADMHFHLFFAIGNYARVLKRALTPT